MSLMLGSAEHLVLRGCTPAHIDGRQYQFERTLALLWTYQPQVHIADHRLALDLEFSSLNVSASSYGSPTAISFPSLADFFGAE